MLEQLKKQFTWPEEKPDLPFDSHGWFTDDNKASLKQFIKSNTLVILEIGAWLGKSTRWLLEESNGIVVTIDTWEGSKEHKPKEIQDNSLNLFNECKNRLPILYDQFIANCWDYKASLIPVKLPSSLGINVVGDYGVHPDLIYLDGSHEYLDVMADLRAIKKQFPEVQLVGDDYNFPGVRDAIYNMSILTDHKGGAWWEV